jgi:DNA polymerase-3 subunit chi
MNPSVIFLHVADAKTKITRLCNAIHQNFAQGKRIFINTPSPEASHYLDELLWSHPAESFIPHEVTQQASMIPVVISQRHENLNKAQILINLCAQINPNYNTFEKIYELWDQTHPAKEQESQQRKYGYEQLGIPFYIESNSICK